MSDFPSKVAQSFPSPDDDLTNPVRKNILTSAATIAQAAGGAVAGGDGREVQDLANAVLLLAQAYATFDPMRMAGGDTAETRVRATPVTPSDHDRDGQLNERKKP